MPTPTNPVVGAALVAATLLATQAEASWDMFYSGERAPAEAAQTAQANAAGDVRESFGGDSDTGVQEADDSGANGDQGDAPSKPRPAGQAAGGSHQGHGTHYAAIGPLSACGVPKEEYFDADGKELPFGALNTNSMFENGKHCGRWAEVTLGQNCVNSGHGTWSVCDSGQWVTDSDTGKKLNVYISDMCPDENFWCKMDDGHIDISEAYMRREGVRAKWNGRKITWNFIDGTPGGYNMGPLKFMWKGGSKFQPGNSGHGFFLSLVVVNPDNGVSLVEQEMSDGKFKPATQLNELGQQWVLNEDHGSKGTFNLRVLDASGKPYGTFPVKFSCPGGTCGSYTYAS